MSSINEIKIQFDEKDDAILQVLRDNSSLSIQQIAKKTGIPVATVHNRIKRLKAEGVIQKYTVVINKAKLGRKMVAHILIKAMPKTDHIALLNTLIRHDLVEDGSAITGAFDLLVKVRVADIDELDRFVLKYLRTFSEVAQSETMLAFQNISKV